MRKSKLGLPKKIKKSTLLKRLHNKAWKLTSELVRKLGGGTCYTCPARGEWKEFQCGHFKHGTLDYDIRNLKSQCPQCNKWGRGKLDEYALRLVRENGLEWVEQLTIDAARAKGKKYLISELEEIIKDREAKLESL